jgi:high affinity sulfate transporter 1
MPALTWLSHYDRTWFRSDVVAGVTLAAYLLPSGIGTASLANLPPEMGLYACLYAGLAFWLFCSSRYTAISVSSAIALLIGSTLGGLADGDSARFAALASGTALIVSAIGLVAWLVQAGDIVRFISEAVMVGFKCGVALCLVSTQLPKLFGFSGGQAGFWENSAQFLSDLPETNFAALTTGAVALTVLIVGKIYFRTRPVALLVVAGGILASPLLQLEARGVDLLGQVPSGLPVPRLPGVNWSDLNQLFPLALACFLLAAVETAAIGRMLTAKHGGRFDANQEFLALATANLAAGVGCGFPVSGGMSQSVVNEGGGARTPLSGLIAAGFIVLVILFVSPLLRSLPQPVLAAVVLVAVSGLLRVSTLAQFWRSDRMEFVVAMAALLGVLGSGLLRGVLIGAIISLVLLLRRASRPHVAQLGRISGTRRFSDHHRHPENELIPGVLIFRPESSLLYFNVDHICDAILARSYQDTPPPKKVILDLSAAPYLDMQSAHTLADLARELRASGITLQAVGAHAAVRDRLRKEGVDALLGRINRHGTIADAVDDASREVRHG